MIPLVLTFVGDDRPGLVNAISEKVVDFGGTWLESRSVRLGGKFAGVVLVNVPDESLIPLESALAKLAPSGLRVSVERGATVFLTSHVLEIVEKLCTDVGIIARGKLVYQGSMAEARAAGSLEEMFLKAVGGDHQETQKLSWLEG